MSHNTQQLVKNTGFLYLRMILVMIVSLFTSRIVLHKLGFEDFGLYNVVGSVVVFLSFLQAALRNATSRYLTYDIGKGDRENITKTFSMSINAHILLAVVMLLLLEIGGLWFINNKLNVNPSRMVAANWTFQFSLLTFCISIIRTPFESNIIAHERMNFFAMTSIVEVFLKLLVVYMLVLLNADKLIVFSALTMCVTFVLLIWYVYHCSHGFSDSSYVFLWDREVIIKFSKYSGWSMLVNGACIARSQCINIFFNLFLGVIANAAMGIANQVISALNVFVANFSQAFRPQIIKSWASKDYDYFYRLVFLTSKVSYLLLLMLTIPLICNLDFALNLWLGEYPATAPIFIETIILYYLIDALQEPLVTSVHATGNLRFHQIMIATIVFLVIPISYFMLQSGSSGSSVLVLNAFSNLVCAVGRTVYMRSLIKLDIMKYLKEVILPVITISILSIPLPLYISYQMDASWNRLLLTTVISLIITLMLSYVVGLSRNEKRQVHKLLSFKKSLA